MQPGEENCYLLIITGNSYAQMAADICGVLTVILIGGVFLFVGVSTLPTSLILGGICLLTGIVAILISVKVFIWFAKTFITYFHKLVRLTRCHFTPRVILR